MRFRSVVTIFVVVTAVSATEAMAQAPLESAGKTNRIQYVESTTTADGLSWDFYRNLDYPCSVSGYQTFAVGTRPGSDPAAPAPLWVRMRGGGVGFFDAAGNPLPSDKNKTENDLDKLIKCSEGNDLNDRINQRSEGFRDVSVSMCSHDIYGGGDQIDPNNPNLTPDGQPRHTNGLFATKAAIRFVQEHYPTTRTFLHGTSAGSAGTWYVAYSLQLEDRPVTAFVADAGVANFQNEIDQDNAGTSCARGPAALAAIAARIHPDLGPANQPDLLIGRGDLTAPVFNIWSRNDTNACGDEQLPCTLTDGTVQVLSGSECRESRISAAIRALPPERHSVDLPVCVASANGPAGNCLRHVVTEQKPSEFPNTDPAGPADYNGAILDWVGARLGDVPPTLAVNLGKRKKLKVTSNRVSLTCISGGYEQRSCSVKLEARMHGKRRVLGRGKTTIEPGAGRRPLRVKLTHAGRQELKDASRRGVRLRARVTVGERYTDRMGGTSRRLRLLRRN